MTTRDTGLTGSSNTFDTSSSASQHSALIDQHHHDHNSAMSATTVYSAPYYPPATYNHNQSNPPLIYRRPSQPGLPTSSAQCTPVPASASFTVSDQQASNPVRNHTGPPITPSTLQQFAPTLSHPVIRTNSSTPITHTLSQPHPRIPYSTPPTPINTGVHLDIVNHPVTDIVTMLAAKLQNLITTNDRLKHSSSSSGTVFQTSTSSNKADPRLLSFHARNIPSITITAYLNRILKYCPTDPEVFISVLVYFDRILRIASDHAQPIFGSYYSSFSVSHTPTLVRSTLPVPAHDDTFTIDSFNVHRLVITTIAVATKFFSDQFYTNSRYARVRIPSLHLTIGRRLTPPRIKPSRTPIPHPPRFQSDDSTRRNPILCRPSPTILVN